MKALKDLVKKNSALIDNLQSIEICDKTIPFAPGKITVVASRPNMGRSLAMYYFFVRCAEQLQLNQMFVSNENSEEDVFLGIIAAINKRLPQSNKTLPEKNRINAILNNKRHRLLSFNGAWEELLVKLEKNKKHLQNGALFIDKIEGLYSNKYYQTRSDELIRIMFELRQWAEKNKVAVMISASVSSKVALREDKTPQLTDLKYCDEIEDFSRTILILVRYENYNIFYDDDGNDMEGLVRIFAVKNIRNTIYPLDLFIDETHQCLMPFKVLDRMIEKQPVLDKLMYDLDLTE